MIRKGFKENVIEIYILRLSAKFSNISIICVHIPTKDAEDEKKNTFYGKLLNEFDRIQRHDVKIVIDYFNAKIGKENTFIPNDWQI